jgi:uncharacterized protein (TIGR02722 family)
MGTALGVIPAVLAGCGGGNVSYGDADAVETMTVDFGSTDLQMIAAKMVDSLLVHPVLSDGARPVVAVSQVRNKTAEHIDVKAVTDKIRTALVRSGKVRFAAREINEELLSELEYQQSGFVKPETARKLGEQTGVQYLLFGEVMSITKKAGRKQDVYYKITLNLADVQSGIIEWADEKEIRKGAKKPLVGG